MRTTSQRAGVYVTQPTGYRAFLPHPLPPEPPLAMTPELVLALAEANLALGRLDGATETMPNPELFTLMYVRREAVLSSRIEGTQASLDEVLDVEAQVLDPESHRDVSEVLNYIAAMTYGQERLKELPVSVRLIREIHAKVLAGTRGREKTSGEIRTTQNWIGPPNRPLNEARFVPPPPHEVGPALGAWERFVHGDDPLPPLIKIALLHAQFETIHPFADGNGRVGRLLITFLLYEQEVLRRPLLYLSYYFKENQTEYYDRLQSIRDHGRWEEWTLFFLNGVTQVANDATRTAREIVALREELQGRIAASGARNATSMLALLTLCFERPRLTVPLVARTLGLSHPSASKLVAQFESFGILTEDPKSGRPRVYVFERYLRLFDDEVRVMPPEAVLESIAGVSS